MEGNDVEDVAIGRRRKEELKRKSSDKNTTKSAESVLLEKYEDEAYSVKYGRSGKCIIFNHVTFTCGCDDRPDSVRDSDALEAFFGKRGFDVKVYTDRKVSQIYAILENESQERKEYHDSAGSFVCCVLTHGRLKDGQEYLYAKDNIYPTECLFAPFSGNRCKPLAGKPKLFFINACRGENYDSGVNVFYKLFETGLFPRVIAESSDSPSHISEPLLCCKIPERADFLIAYSTAPKHIAWSRKGEGSWFIQALCQVLESRADESDLLSMLTIVCRKVACEYESYLTESTVTDSMKQVPSLYSTLTKMVKFPPRVN